MFLGFKNLFVGSLHFENLHGLELNTFLAIPGNKFCHGNTLSVFYLYINIFVGSLHSKVWHELELTSFLTQFLATSFAMATLFSVSFTYV